jgi:hypothetical protein
VYENIELKVDGTDDSTYTVAAVYKHITHRVFISLLRPEKVTVLFTLQG